MADAGLSIACPRPKKIAREEAYDDQNPRSARSHG